MRPFFTFASLVCFVACAGQGGARLPAGAVAAAGPAAPPEPAPTLDQRLRAALAGRARTPAEGARDGARHPRETLEFFGLRDDARVVELWPGGGYYTAILAPVLAECGQLVVTHFDPAGDPKDANVEESKAILERLAAAPDVFAKVGKQQIARPMPRLGPGNSADFVFTFRNVHNWIAGGYAGAVFASIAHVLKPGGVLGVEEHRGRPGMTMKEIRDNGYVPEDVVIALAERVGLELVGRSELNANPRDTKDHPSGVWSLPPTFAEKEADHDKYAAIGESDRMTLKFVKR